MSNSDTGMVEIPAGFIRLRRGHDNVDVIVRAASVEAVTRSTVSSDTYVRTSNGGVFVVEAWEEVLSRINAALSHNKEGEGR